MKISEISNKNTNLDEIKMTPTAVKSRVSQLSGVTVGIEFELVVRDFSEDAGPRRSTPDYDRDEYVNDSSWEKLRSDIRDFFRGEYNSLNNILTELDTAYGHYQEWKKELWDDYVAENYDDWHLEYTDDDSDIEDQPYRDLFEREKYDDFEETSGSIKNWLEDRGLVLMSNWIKKYNLTWPHWLKPDTSHMRGYEEITDSFQKAVGMDVDYATEYHKGDRPIDSYMIEPDSSIKPDNATDDFGLEFISPPLPLEDAIEQIKQVKSWAQAGNAYTNSTTGLHMNISLPGYSIDNLDYIKLVLFLGDEWILDQFKRSSNEYARSSIDFINQRISNNVDLLPQALEKMRQGFNNLASKIIHQGYTQKTLSVSMLDNRVEFRAPGNNWLDMNLNTVINTLMHNVDVLNLALDPQKEKREYTKKLYKLLAPVNPDAIKLFVDYQNGEINRDQLKRTWAQQVLGFSGQLQRQLAGSTRVAGNILRSDLRRYPIVRLPDGEIVSEVDAINYDTALKKAFEFMKNQNLLGTSWYLYDPVNPNQGRNYNLTGRKFKHNRHSANPRELYDLFSDNARKYNVSDWYMEPALDE